MKDIDVKIGMKVVPFQKTVWGDFSESQVWNRNVSSQGFLYVQAWDLEEEAWILGDIDGLTLVDGEEIFDGDFFNACDFEPYKERGMKDKDVEIGMKVVPHSKTLCMSLEAHNQTAGKKDFMYVIRQLNAEAWVLNNKADADWGDFFKASDFEPYEEKSRQVTSDFVPRPPIILTETYNGAFILEQIGTGKSYSYGTLSGVHQKLSELFD